MSVRGICLVIEDDADIGGLLEAILAGEGFDVHVETTGTGGLAAAARLEPALITLDLGLPDMHGHDVARTLRERTTAPILMITALARPGDEIAGFAAGASAYLAKPFRPAELRDLVSNLLPDTAPGTTTHRAEQ